MKGPRRISRLRASALLLATAMGLVTAACFQEFAYESEFIHPFTTNPANGSCLPLDGVVLGEFTRQCDPLNLVFEDMEVGEVVRELRERGWTTRGRGSPQWVYFSRFLSAQQVTQLFWWNAEDQRYHMRLWRARSGGAVFTIAGVHHEARIGGRDAIDMAWEDAESFVATQFCVGIGPGFACHRGHPIDEVLEWQETRGDPGEWRGWANDGFPTVIRRFPQE